MSLLQENSPGFVPPFYPEVDTPIFNDAPDAKYWVGIVASEESITLPGIYHAARVFRANSYIDDHNFLPPTARQADGGEMDADDWRSAHFVALEKNGGDKPLVVGNIRSILKRDEADLLPVETHFPEAFEGAAAPVGSVEASRFIAKHTEKLVQGAISLGLMRSLLMSSLSHQREPIYAIVETPLMRRFKGVGLPFELIAEPKPLEDYNNTINMGIKFDPQEVMTVVDNDQEGAHLITHFFRNARANNGLGHYDAALINHIQK